MSQVRRRGTRGPRPSRERAPEGARLAFDDLSDELASFKAEIDRQLAAMSRTLRAEHRAALATYAKAERAQFAAELNHLAKITSAIARIYLEDLDEQGDAPAQPTVPYAGSA